MLKLERVGSPILKPIAENSWESQAVLNPGTLRQGDVVHMLYRAVEGDNCSTIGYAKLDRFGNLLERRPNPVIQRTLDFESRGCEDARIVLFNDKIYIFYMGFDSEDVRVGLASTTDWRQFEKYGKIGPDIFDKDAMIFPERIEGKVAYLHRIEPDIQIAFFESIDELVSPDESYWPQYLEHLEHHVVMKPKYDWESVKIGTGPPPIKTNKGWLLLYHGVDKNLVYRCGAAMLDLDDPMTVIGRIPYPILEPERDYEQLGDVPNVVFPQGTAVFDNTLYVYYGGADKVIGLAQVALSELIDELGKYKE